MTTCMRNQMAKLYNTVSAPGHQDETHLQKDCRACVKLPHYYKT